MSEEAVGRNLKCFASLDLGTVRIFAVCSEPLEGKKDVVEESTDSEESREI